MFRLPIRCTRWYYWPIQVRIFTLRTKQFNFSHLDIWNLKSTVRDRSVKWWVGYLTTLSVWILYRSGLRWDAWISVCDVEMLRFASCPALRWRTPNFQSIRTGVFWSRTESIRSVTIRLHPQFVLLEKRCMCPFTLSPPFHDVIFEHTVRPVRNFVYI